MSLYIDYEGGDIEVSLPDCVAVKRSGSNLIEIWDEDAETLIGSFYDFKDNLINVEIVGVMKKAYLNGFLNGTAYGKKVVQHQLKTLIFGDESGNRE
jgi:hypothetical protein